MSEEEIRRKYNVVSSLLASPETPDTLRRDLQESMKMLMLRLDAMPEGGRDSVWKTLIAKAV